MSTITDIARAIEETGARVADLQGRITADKVSLMEARAMMEAEHRADITAEIQAVNDMVTLFTRLHDERRARMDARHARLMAFIDGQIAAKDDAIEGEPKAGE
jgi:hypothetical protein